jgi:fermentation-respiration switch protein FrsA (DUF1100 family)
MLGLVNQFVYRPDATFTPLDFTPDELGLAFEEVVVEAADGVCILGWYLPAWNASHTLLYCHGNAGNIGDWVQAAPPFVESGISLLIWDYRGYGRSQGQPSEEGLLMDGLAMWHWLKARAKTDGLPASILGKSLGSAVAAHIATQEKPAGLILDSAFTSMREIVSMHASWVPKEMIPPLYESLEWAPAITCPTLVVHGERDMLVPLTQGQKLFEAITAPKIMRVIPAAGHNDISTYAGYDEAILNFLLDPAGYVAGQS